MRLLPTALAAAVAALLVTALAPSPASAALATRLSGQPATCGSLSDSVYVVAEPGETNVVTVDLDPGGASYTITDTGASMDAGCDCTQITAQKVSCHARADDIFQVLLGDGNDDLTFNAPRVDQSCGGLGDDTLRGGPSSDVLEGGEGSETLVGGAPGG